MDHHERLRKRVGNFRSLTGLTPEAFDTLLVQVQAAHAAALAKRIGMEEDEIREIFFDATE